MPVAPLYRLFFRPDRRSAVRRTAWLPILDPDYQALTEHPCRPRHGIQRDGHIPWVQQAIQLRPAGLKVARHSLFGLLLLLHFLGELPREHSFDRDSLHFFPNTFLFEKTIEGRSAMVEGDLLPILLHGSPLSCFFLLPRARLKSGTAVRRVFLMNPCNNTIRPNLSM